MSKISLSKPAKVYLITLGAVLLASAYPIYMGVVMMLAYLQNGGVDIMDYPKYIIPYTPICISLIVCTSLSPLILKLCKRFALPVISILALVVFFGTEITFEKVTVFSEVVVTREAQGAENGRVIAGYADAAGVGEAGGDAGVDASGAGAADADATGAGTGAGADATGVGAADADAGAGAGAAASGSGTEDVEGIITTGQTEQPVDTIETWQWLMCAIIPPTENIPELIILETEEQDETPELTEQQEQDSDPTLQPGQDPEQVSQPGQDPEQASQLGQNPAAGLSQQQDQGAATELTSAAVQGAATGPIVAAPIINPLITEYSPLFKMHFYLISVVIILSVLNLVYGFYKMSRNKDYKKRKPLVVQLIAVLVFIGLCILACFTAFYRTGEIVVSPISAVLMTVFFLIFGFTAGVYTGTCLYGKRKLFSSVIPSVVAVIVTVAMYIGEMVMMDWNLYRFGTGVIFDPIGACPLAPIDFAVILLSGVFTYIILHLVRQKETDIS